MRLLRSVDSIGGLILFALVGGVVVFALYQANKLGNAVNAQMNQALPPTWFYLFPPMIIAFWFNKFRGNGNPNNSESPIEAPKVDDVNGNMWNLDYRNHPTTGLYGRRDVTLAELQSAGSNWDGGMCVAFTLDVSTAKVRTSHYGTAGTARVPAGTRYLYGGKAQSTIQGDPRAIAVLAYLTEGLTVQNMGILNPASKLNHNPVMGCAIDIVQDETMNAIVARAIQHKIPIAWISKYKADNGKWPIYQVVNGVKTLRGYSTQNHDSHYHLDLPRPNWGPNQLLRTRYI